MTGKGNKMQQLIVSRRRLLQLSGVGIGAATLAACATPTQPVATSNEPAAVVETLPTAANTAAPTVAATETPAVVVEAAPTDAVALYDGLTHGITAEGFPYLGDPNAPLTMTDYSDFL